MTTIPLYLQIAEALRCSITEGEFRPGDRFPTERQISERYQVSRPTANKALAALVAEGRLEVHTGAGTYVCAPTLDYDLRRLVSFTAKAEAAGGQPSTRVVGFAIARAAAIEAEDCCRALALPGYAEVYDIERLRLVDGQPVIHERRWVPVDCCPGLSTEDLAGSLYTCWQERFGIAISGADQRIRAVALDPLRAGHLGLKAGDPALEVRCTGWSGGVRRLWRERTVYRGDAYEFSGSIGLTPPGDGGIGHIRPSRMLQAPASGPFE